MKYALALAAVSALVLIPLAGRAVWRHFKQTQSTFDRLVDESITRHPAGKLTPLPGNFTCGRCMENPALPHQAWCAVCTPIVDQWPAEPIERGAK